MAKTAAERMKAMRARNKDAGLKQFRIYAPEDLHTEIREFANELIEQREMKMNDITINLNELTESQKDGLSCCVCGGESGAMKLVEIGREQLFVCCQETKEIHFQLPK
jgi:hypothetical protein